MPNRYQDILPIIFKYSQCDEEEKQKRNLLIILVLITAVAGILYSLFYNLLGVRTTNWPIGIYVTFCIINLIQYYVFAHYPLFRTLQMIGILLFPTATHYLNGGFDQSSVVVLAAMLSPLGALTFHSAKGAKLFFYLFLLMIAFSAIADFYLVVPRTEIPKAVKMLFYFFNITTITSICFFMLQKFLSDSEKVRAVLKDKNNEILKEKNNVESALNELRLTQEQLIQSEKMASLGELTAGIAHEIQNPLNFVNNFSEVTLETLHELKQAVKTGKIEEINDYLNDFMLATEKINYHGKRASDIVKSMLQHSRKSSANKELIEINALCEEYLRLAYHGLRAKDSSFIAEYETHLDDTIEKISIHPQEIGRVLLNLINNAFYEVNEKSKTHKSAYAPKVTVTTKRYPTQISIVVEDNGMGIPKNIKEKIFQPFFTTKPTGKGTGLGLSLSYDIIKAHQGTLQVESEEGQGCKFIIMLPY